MKRTAPPNTTATGWEQLRRRLKRIQAKDDATQLTPEQARVILEERARLLAQPPAIQLDATEIIEMVSFVLADETYALETKYVREVVRLGDFTPVPGAPPFLVGVLNLRGDILAIFDLRSFFHLAASPLGEQSRVLVLGIDRPEFGLLADAAEEVRSLRTAGLLEPPASVSGVGREYVRGVTSEALIVIDGAHLLDDSRLFIDQDEGLDFMQARNS